MRKSQFPTPNSQANPKRTIKNLSFVVCLGVVSWSLGFLLSGCEKATYKHETIKQSVAELAKKEYGLDVTVKESGRTLGVQFEVKNLLSELVAEDQQIWKHM